MSTALERLAWGTDAGFYRYIPEEVVHPESEEEVRQLMARAAREKKSITFRAAGTSLSGQACGPSLLVVVGKKWEKYEVLEDGKTIRLQPGMVGARVNEILRPYGRYFTPDPASIKSAMVGGIVMNNASGMCCGTHANSYRMLRSVRMILSDGTVVDTGSEESREAFRRSHPEFLRRIEELRQRTLQDRELYELIEKKYRIKNVTGLTLLPFVEYTDPFDIMAHLLVGSEGTLAFLSEVVMETGDVHPYSASALLLFATTDRACRFVTALKKTGLPSAVEYFDRRSMRVVEADFPQLKGLPDDAGAELIKVEARTEEELKEKVAAIEKLLEDYPTLGDASFTSDPELTGRYWAMRSGIFPAVGATRPVGTTCLIEDIAFPIEFLADATADLERLFREHNYPDAVIYGHALEGNYHFILNQRFDSQAAQDQYENMMQAVIGLVVDKYHGSLKAEHGTGRNMAPFVAREWGEKAYRLMCDVKALFDPQGLLNPDVIFTHNPAVYLQHIKPLPEVHPLVDRCIECGFCEVNCVACGMVDGSTTRALSSRQRVVVMREVARLRKRVLQTQGQEQAEARKRLNELEREFARPGRELCAGDGLCSTSCPVGLNVGEFVHVLRGEAMGKTGHCVSQWAAEHFAACGSAVGSVLQLADFGRNVLGDRLMQTVCKGLHYAGVPLWTPAIPKRTPAGCTSDTSSSRESRDSRGGGSPCRVVYFPSCLNQRLGVDKRAKAPFDRPLVEVMKELLAKAGYEVVFPKGMENLCCGTIWESKGDEQTADKKTAELFAALEEATNHWQYMVLCDQSPCLHRMRQYAKAHYGGEVHLYEPVEFIQHFVLERVDITPMEATVAVHATCSTREMGLLPSLLQVARACATKVVFPEEVGCCAFAGDKGFTHPELNEWALRKLRKQIEKEGVEYGFSNSRTCEIGLTTYSGVQYMNVAYLVNHVAQAKK